VNAGDNVFVRWGGGSCSDMRMMRYFDNYTLYSFVWPRTECGHRLRIVRWRKVSDADGRGILILDNYLKTRRIWYKVLKLVEMLIAPKRLKLRTSNLMCMFPGTVQTRALKNFAKKNSLGGDMHSHERLHGWSCTRRPRAYGLIQGRQNRGSMVSDCSLKFGGTRAVFPQILLTWL